MAQIEFDFGILKMGLAVRVSVESGVGTILWPLQILKFLRTQHCLPQDATQCTDGNFAVLRHDCSDDTISGEFDELSMTPSPWTLLKTSRFKLLFDCSIRQRSKRHRFQPQLR